MAKRRKQTPQQIKIDGFRFPYQLLQDIRTLKDEGAKIHSSMYATLLIILKQIYLEGSSKGYVQELNLSKWAKQLGLLILVSIMEEFNWKNWAFYMRNK